MYRREFFGLIKLAAPLVVAQVAQNTLSFIDTLMVGRLGNESLAGIALGATVFHFVLIVLSGVIFGVNPVVSQAIGAGERDKAVETLRQGLLIGALLFLPALIFYWNSYPVMIALGQDPDTASASSEYLKAISWGLLPALLMMALRGFLEGNSNTMPIMVVSILGIGANIVLNYALMFGKFGFPELGLVGTGYASSIVYSCGFLLIVSYVFLKYPDDQIFIRIWKPNFAMIGELFRVGGPIGLTLGFEMGMFSAAAITMGTLSATELAAHQIALQTASTSFMIPLGIAIATSVRVGQAVGANEIDRAEVAGYTGMITCCVVMSCFAFLFWIVPKSIISIYLDTSDLENMAVIEFAFGFLAIAALFQIVDGLQVAASNCLRGLKDTTAAMYLTLISYWVIGVPTGAILCFIFDLRGNGLWLGMTVGLAAAAVLLTARFRQQIGQRLAKGKR